MSSESPVRFSQELVDSLQASTEVLPSFLIVLFYIPILTPRCKTDSTRAKTLELHIQSRVASELKRLQERATKDFEELQAKISAAEETTQKKSAGETLRDLGRDAVQNDVVELKKKLERTKKMADVDEGVEKAKAEVVRCLRENDRRPLDCYKEVERFREEVRRLEGVWVEKVVR
jgi:altered-inheritance-of-mitochondria protein 13